MSARGSAEQRWVAVYAAAIVHEYTSAGRLDADVVADPVNWMRWAEEAATVADLAEEGFATLDATKATPPHDGGPAMRPHSISGWWQVWQGGICVALLRPEDAKAGELRSLETFLRDLSERVERGTTT